MTQIIQCNICDKAMQRRSLTRHMQNQHDTYQRPARRTPITPMFDSLPQTYRISMNNIEHVDCPVPDCPAIVKNRYNMRAHFCYRHWQDIIIIAEEGLFALPRCPSCLLLGSNIHTPRHRRSQTCIDGTLRHLKRLQQQANEYAEDTVLQIQDLPIANVDTFKYLGRMLSATSNDTPAIQHNIMKAKKTWGRIRTLLKREGADKRTATNFYKAIVQSTLLYASETWQTTQDALQPLMVFHNMVARHLSNRHIRKIPNTDIWVYPDMDAAFRELNLMSISEYIHKRKTNLVYRTQNRPVYLQARNLEILNAGTRLFWGSDMIL
jgi:hypothetical protein